MKNMRTTHVTQHDEKRIIPRTKQVTSPGVTKCVSIKSKLTNEAKKQEN